MGMQAGTIAGCRQGSGGIEVLQLRPLTGHTLCTLRALPLLSELGPALLSDGGSLEGWQSSAQRWTFP